MNLSTWARVGALPWCVEHSGRDRNVVPKNLDVGTAKAPLPYRAGGAVGKGL